MSPEEIHSTSSADLVAALALEVEALLATPHGRQVVEAHADYLGQALAFGRQQAAAELRAATTKPKPSSA